MQTGSHIVRQKFVIVVMVLMWAGLAGKIGALQLLNHEQLRQKAQDQRVKEITVSGNRGMIFDRNGEQLAINLESASYGLRTPKTANKDSAAAVLCSATGIDAGKIKNMLDSGKSFQWLLRKADLDVIKNMDCLKMKFVEKIPEQKRFYPKSKIAAQIVGYTDIDSKGIDGCEYFFDKELSGKNGQSVVLRDAKHRVIPSFEEPSIKPQDGSDIILTIDSRIQEIAEEELEEGVAKFNAESGGAIVLNTRTGEILAMANAPRFDPNDPSYCSKNNIDPKFRKNRLITDMMEPGSIFKIVAFTEAFESGVVKESDLINCENGIIRIGTHPIKDSHVLGIVQACDVMTYSSNIGTLKIAEKIGKQKLYERARLYGFGEITGFDIPNESPGRLDNPVKWSNLSLPTISFGQGVAVSPLQISMAYSAIANGGTLLSPRIIKEIRMKNGAPSYQSKVTKIRQVMTPETAERIIRLLCSVVEKGTGVNAALPNIKIAGKTGTAQRVIEGVKGYADNQYTSSFIGFIVDREPRLLCLVMIDNPLGIHYGSQVAAPVFRNIVNRILNMTDKPVELVQSNPQKSLARTFVLPDLKGMTVAEAVKKIRFYGLNPIVIGDTTTVKKQFPVAGAELNHGSNVTIYSNVIKGVAANGIEVPNLLGKTVREAVQNLIQLNLDVKVRGTGVVQIQAPEPGSVVAFGTVCTIECSKRN